MSDIAATPEDLQALTSADLSALAAEVAVEQHRRAVEGGDIEALTEWGFENMFNAKSKPSDPIVKSGLLVVAGSLTARSKSSHDCTWVDVHGMWIWDYDDQLSHVRRTLPGPPEVTRAISLLVPYENLELNLVSCKQSRGEHKMTSARSFTVKASEVELVATRARPTDR